VPELLLHGLAVGVAALALVIFNRG